VVKLRGLRIDLGETAGAVLAAAPHDLADAAVTMRGDPQQFLACHAVLRPGRRLGEGQLGAPPHYVVPSAIIPLERLPVTPDGKLEARALEILPLPDFASAVDGRVSGEEGKGLTPMETKLRAIWIDPIGLAARAVDILPHSSFFAVGGSSLLLVHLLHAVHKLLGVKVHLRALLDNQDLRSMAKMIENQK